MRAQGRRHDGVDNPAAVQRMDGQQVEARQQDVDQHQELQELKHGGIDPGVEPAGKFGTGVSARPLTRPRMDLPVIAAWRRDAPENQMLDAVLETAPSE